MRGIPLLRHAGVSEFCTTSYLPHSLLVFIALVSAGILVRSIQRNHQKETNPATLRNRFQTQVNRLAESYRRHAMDEGRPHGLLWLKCQIAGEPILVTDRSTASPLALASLFVDVEPADGSGLEDVAAARTSRTVTGIFAYEGGEWKPTGRALFNLVPAEVVARSNGRYVPLDPPHPPARG